MLRACIALGGTVTGEHGVGLDKAEKLALLFIADDLEVMHAVRRVFDPARAHESPEGVPVGQHACAAGSAGAAQAGAGGHVGLAAADVGRELAEAVAPADGSLGARRGGPEPWRACGRASSSSPRMWPV